MSLLRDVFAPYGGLGPRMAGLEDCGSLFSHRRTENVIAANYLVSHLLRIRQASVQGGPGDVFLLPRADNPADGLTRVRGDMAPLLRILGSRRLHLGSSRPLRGVSSREGRARV